MLWIYATLLINTDVRGYVTVSNDELANAADMSLSQARAYLYALHRMGEIEMMRKGTRWRKSEWRITRVAELAA